MKTNLTRRLGLLSGVLQVAAWLVGVLGIAGGVALALHSEQQVTDLFGYTTETVYPYVELGIGVTIAAILIALVLAWFGYAGRVIAAANAPQLAAEAAPYAPTDAPGSESTAPHAPATGNTSQPTKWAAPHAPAEPAVVG